MDESKYKVMIGNDVVGERMDIKTATILIKALFEEYYADHSMIVSIKEMERIENANGGIAIVPA